MELIDTHCHLEYDYAPKQISDLVQEAQKEGVQTLVTIGTTLESWDKVALTSEQFSNVYHTLGIHPHDAFVFTDAQLETLLQKAKHPKCKGIGEIGLDYYYEHAARDAQKIQLQQQLDLAIASQLPVVIHGRDSEDDLYPMLESYAKRTSLSEAIGVLHCFTGTLGFAQKCVELGFYVSFSGILTFKNASDVRQVAAELPLHRIVVETDAPYLAPIPYRGKRCEPSMVKWTAIRLGELHGQTLQEIADRTTTNAKRLFRL